MAVPSSGGTVRVLARLHVEHDPLGRGASPRCQLRVIAWLRNASCVHSAPDECPGGGDRPAHSHSNSFRNGFDERIGDSVTTIALCLCVCIEVDDTATFSAGVVVVLAVATEVGVWIVLGIFATAGDALNNTLPLVISVARVDIAIGFTFVGTIDISVVVIVIIVLTTIVGSISFNVTTAVSIVLITASHFRQPVGRTIDVAQRRCIAESQCAEL